MAARVRSIEIGTVSTSPQSATRSRSNGCTLSTGCHGRISEDCSRTARGPKRAPVRYDDPPSYGTPISATSSSATSRTCGSSMKVAIWPKRGDRNGSRGVCILEHRLETGHRAGQPRDLVGRGIDGEARADGPDDSEVAHQRLGTVMPGPHRDPLGVEERGRIVGVEVG